MTENLAAKNVEFLSEKFPRLVPYLTEKGPSVSTLVVEDGRPVDIDLGPAHLYRQAATEYVAEQLAAYDVNPRRMLLQRPTGTGLDSPVSVRMLTHLLTTVRDEDIRIEPAPTEKVAFLIVFGVGLGLHLEPLLRRYDVQQLILIEPFHEFLRHSLHVADWQSIFDVAAERGTEIKFILSKKPEEIMSTLGSTMNASALAFLDGSYVYTHYNSWIFKDAQERLAQSMQHYFISKGYFEDERKMINNTAGNFFEHEFRLIDRGAIHPRREPVFIVGSGPSIDTNIDVVKKWRDHAIVFSIGTGLQVVLSQGIVPDYHCELENGPHIPEVLGHVAAKYSFKGIKLIASSTVNPKAATFFDEAYFFFRDTVSSTLTFGAGHANVKGAAPTVSNTAFTISTLLGFREIYLFGVDCGAKDTSLQHSMKSIYGTMDAYKDKKQRYGMRAPGNFGGYVMADWIFDMARRMLEEVQKRRRVKLYNCSDGALVAGSAPRLAATLSFATPLDRDKVAQDIRDLLPLYGPGQFFSSVDVDRFVRYCDEFREAGRIVLTEAREQEGDVESFHARITEFVKRAEKDYAGVSRTISGSLHALLRIAAFFLVRVRDDEQRKRLFTTFVDEYAAIFDEMVGDARGLFAGVAERMADRDAAGQALSISDR